MASTSTTFTIEDTTAPLIDTAASDLTVESDGLGNTAARDLWLVDNGLASALDVCSDVSWSHDFMWLSDNCGATGSAMVTFAHINR